MTALIGVDEALQLIAQHRVQPASASIALDKALGQTLAEPVVAKRTQPPGAVSAMDGYAVRLADVAAQGAALSVIGVAPAGQPFEGAVAPGQAVRIFTGAQLPVGADHIVIQEDADQTGDTVTCNGAWQSPRHVRPAGLDFKQGEVLIAPGTRIGPAELMVAAAANHDHLTVHKPVKVAILANGDELKRPGSDLKRGDIVSSNPHGLEALVAQWGGVPLDLGIAADSVESIRALIDNAGDADIILPVGGASVGDFDYMRQAFDEAGFDLIFSKIAVKPGKPTWFARRGETRVLGLPGNPASAFVCAHLFLGALMGTPPPRSVTAKLQSPMKANGPRAEYVRATAAISDQGVVTATPLPDQDSSLLVPFLNANCLIVRPPASGALDAGATTDIVLIGRGLGL
ncbi:MAG: gephyrin-like molybdotransferase Glp [Pseudomonadota bacterium]